MVQMRDRVASSLSLFFNLSSLPSMARATSIFRASSGENGVRRIVSKKPKNGWEWSERLRSRRVVLPMMSMFDPV